jgi:hypothetical protein
MDNEYGDGVMVIPPDPESYQFNTRKMIEYSQKVGGRDLTDDEKEAFRIWPKPRKIKINKKDGRVYVL